MSATNRGAARNEADYYPTPEWCVDLILNELQIPDGAKCVEPCRGNGVIFSRLPAPKDWAEIRQGRDYLTLTHPGDLAITNPPFRLALEFLEKSLRECSTVVYLLRLNFLGSKKRKAFWQANPSSHLFILSQRPSFTGRGTDATEYAWFVWDRGGMCKRGAGVYVL